MEDKENSVNEKQETQTAESTKVDEITKGKELDTAKKNKKIKLRTFLVLLVLALFILGSGLIYRASYIECLEIGEEYVDAFLQNVRYKFNIGIVNFIVIFTIVYITNNLIKKGLKKFFDDEKKEMPKLPNKSLALVIALVTSLIISNMFLQKVILFVNATQFGIPDPMFGMDVGFYMFQAPLIRSTFILWFNNDYTFNNLHSCILYYYI